jgi:uncharacterized protein YjbI with pentapeptide repeats
VVFRRCELSGATFERARLERVRFEGCRMAAAAFPECVADDVTFAECQLPEAWFRMATFDRVAFEDCRLERADFYRTTLRRSRLVRCDLTAAELSGAVCSEVALHGSTLTDVRGAGDLRGLRIGSDQVYELALPMFAGRDIVVDDGDDDPPEGP